MTLCKCRSGGGEKISNIYRSSECTVCLYMVNTYTVAVDRCKCWGAYIMYTVCTIYTDTTTPADMTTQACMCT